LWFWNSFKIQVTWAPYFERQRPLITGNTNYWSADVYNPKVVRALAGNFLAPFVYVTGGEALELCKTCLLSLLTNLQKSRISSGGNPLPLFWAMRGKGLLNPGDVLQSQRLDTFKSRVSQCISY